jgi:hypothetical protein
MQPLTVIPSSRCIGAVSKLGFWFKVKAAVKIKPEEYIMYFEDLI